MFNREIGEFIEALGPHYRVVPNSKWQGSPFLEEAAASAAANFKKLGILRKIQFYDANILIQEYPTLTPPRLLFLFAIEWNGKLYYDTFTWKFEPSAIAELKNVGMWDDPEPEIARVN